MWSTISTIFQILLVIINVSIFCAIKFNDLVHLKKEAAESKGMLQKILRRLTALEKKQFAMKSVCDERHQSKK